MIGSSMLLQENISKIVFLVQQQRNNNVIIIMVVIMMMYFIIERASVQIPPPTVKENPQRPQTWLPIFAWLKSPGSAVSIQKSINLPYPLGKALDDPKKPANPGLVQEAEQSHGAWEQTWLCSADRKRNVWWSLGLAHALRGTHTCVKGMGFYCSEMLFHTPPSPFLQTQRKSWGKLVEGKELVDSVWKEN